MMFTEALSQPRHLCRAVVLLILATLVSSFSTRESPQNFDFSLEATKKPTNEEEKSGVTRRALIGSTALAGSQLLFSNFYAPSGFERTYPTRFIAALGPPKSKAGSNAKEWGIWSEDPGPPGVPLKDYDKLVNEYNGRAPAGWIFNQNDWWLEEHGLLMPEPSFPISAGRYLVTGGRIETTGLTIDESGNWSLDSGTLYDVTHLPCRSARYQPTTKTASPANANLREFPVFPGASMPAIPGCSKQDYAVLFLIGKASS